jgi:lysophospholipase L1-like esterase
MTLRIVVLTLAVCAVPVLSASSEGSVEVDPNRFAEEIEVFEQWDSRNATPTDPVLFIGSSSIRMWRTRESFPDIPAINRGFGGAHISDVMHFARRLVLPYKPSLILFYAGDNDVAAGKSSERVFGDYRRFTAWVETNLPQTPIIFLSIKPSAQRWAFWPEMKAANDRIRAFCERGEQLYFVDLATPLLGADGLPDSDLFIADQLHLSAAGYAVWTEALAPLIRQVRKAQP